MKTYRSNWIGSVIWFILTGAAAAAASIYLLPEYNLYLEYHQFLIYPIVLLEWIALFIWFRCWIIRIEIDEAGIRFKRGKKIYKQFCFHDYEFQPSVTRSMYNGIIHSDRYLLCRGKDSLERLKCHHFSKRTFSEMAAQIIALQDQQEEGEEKDLMIYRTFTLPNGMTGMSYRRNPFLFSSIIMFVIFLITGVMMLYNDQVSNIVALSPPALLLVVVVFFAVKQGRMNVRTPQEIQIYPNSIRVDERFFHLNEISRVTATHPWHEADYVINRNVVIHLTSGRSEKYSFGIQSPNKQLQVVFGEYQEMCEGLQQLLGERFQYEL